MASVVAAANEALYCDIFCRTKRYWHGAVLHRASATRVYCCNAATKLTLRGDFLCATAPRLVQ